MNTECPCAAIAALFTLAVGAVHAAPVDDAVADAPARLGGDQVQGAREGLTKRASRTLAAKAQKVTVAYPDRAEPLIWEGIVVSSLAGAKGGLGALGLAKQAKTLYESALRLAARRARRLRVQQPRRPVLQGAGLAGRLRRQGEGAGPAAEGARDQSAGHRPELLLRRVPGRDGQAGRCDRLPESRTAGAGAPRPRHCRRRPARRSERAARKGTGGGQVPARTTRGRSARGRARRATTRKPDAACRAVVEAHAKAVQRATRWTIDRPRPLPGVACPGGRKKRSPRRARTLGGDPGTIVLDNDASARANRAPARRAPLPQRVVDEVAHQQRQQRLVAGHRQRGRFAARPFDIDVAARGFDQRKAVRQRVLHDAPPVDGAAVNDCRRARLDAGQRQELRAPRAPGAGCPRRRGRTRLAAWPGLRRHASPPIARAAPPAACAARALRPP